MDPSISQSIPPAREPNYLYQIDKITIYAIIKTINRGFFIMSNLANFDSSHELTKDLLQRNTQNVVALFDHWELRNDEVCNLLGGISPAQLAKYKKGKANISSRDTIERVGNLLGIHKNLRILYPYNKEVVYQWVKRRNKKLHNLSPLDIMLEQGYIGINQIRRFTDHLRGQ